MRVVPQINQFDRFQPYVPRDDGLFEIDSSYLYLIRRDDDVEIPPILKDTILIQKYTIYRGEEISALFEQNINIEDYMTIVAELRVSNTSPNLSPPVVKEMYESKILSEKQCKFICNSTLGTIEKYQNKKKKVVLIKDYSEALLYARRYQCKMYPLHLFEETKYFDQNSSSGNFMVNPPEKENIYTVSKDIMKPLVNGMYPTKLYVYSAMRYQLYGMYKKILAIGGIPTGIHTDCIFFSSDKEVKINKIHSSSFKNIGKLKWRLLEETIAPKKTYQDKTLEMTDKLDLVSQKPSVALQSIENEHEWSSNPTLYEEEAFEKLDQNIHNFINGEQPGGGKTHIGKSYIKHRRALHGERFMAIAPSNKRVIELKKDLGDENVMTLHQLLHLRLSDEKEVTESTMSKKSVLPLIDVLLIDEVYAFDTKSLSFIKNRIMDKFPNMRIIATGDAVQSRVSDVKIDNVDDYYRNVVNSMFPRGISLSINKRMNDPIEQKKLEELKTHIFENRKTPIPHMTYFNDFSLMFERHLVNGEFIGKIVCYHLDTCDMVSKLLHNEFMKRNKDIHFDKVHGMYLYKGQELINRDHRVIAGKTLYVNYSYIVEEVVVELIPKRIKNKIVKKNGFVEWVESQVVHLRDPATGDVFFVPAKSIESFRYNYAVTIHSSQGDTYSDVPLSLFDFDSFYIKTNDKYTAISRTNKTGLVHIYNGESMRVCPKKLLEKIKKRIDSHKTVDVKANRPFTEEEYITTDWVLNKFNTTNFTCPHCQMNYGLTNSTSMKDFSVDRIDNHFAHTKSNCVVSCRSCNVADRANDIRARK